MTAVHLNLERKRNIPRANGFQIPKASQTDASREFEAFLLRGKTYLETVNRQRFNNVNPFHLSYLTHRRDEALGSEKAESNEEAPP